MEGHHNLRPDNWGKIFTDLFTKYSDGYIRIQSVWTYQLLLPLIPAIHRMGNSPNTLCPWSREQEQSHPHLIFHWKLFKTALDFTRGLINLNCNFNMSFKVSSKSKTEASHSNILPTLLKVFFRHFIRINMTK